MSDAHADVSKHVKSYMAVFATLAVLTVVTVLAAQVDISSWGNISLALAIASVKASLVAAIFMHLKWERTAWVWFALLLCAVFLVVLMAVPTLSMVDSPPGVKIGTWG
ncbi:MAG: cytochrome C oxidase subunit IV family protein [Planctomycetes bacterium]|nr:cytochrome C oxidase subunit IV family protein [Planctomycetota bacterium]